MKLKNNLTYVVGDRAGINPEWKKVIDDFFQTKQGKVLEEFLTDLEIEKTNPYLEDIFRVFKFRSPENTSIVILGQDPYYTDDAATGLAFACRDKVQPSLRNILKEVSKDFYDISSEESIIDIDLLSWAAQGVFLLNTALTVDIGNPGSHSKQWEDFTAYIMSYLGKLEGKVFMLWGNHAQSYEGFINHKTNLVLTAAHPSPLSANKGFFGCKHFSKANDYLKENKKSIILW